MATALQLRHWWDTLADIDRHQLKRAIGAYELIANDGITRPTFDLLQRTDCPVVLSVHRWDDQPGPTYSWPPDLQHFITGHSR